MEQVTKEQFYALYDDALADQRADKFIISNYLGISSAVAREISYRACGDIDASLRNCSCERLLSNLNLFIALPIVKTTPPL